MANGYINPWVAGRDEMLRVLADREARAIEAQKRQFEQERMEQQLAMQQQQADDTAAYRQMQAESLAEQRKAAAAAAKALEAERDEKTRQNTAQAEQIAYILSNPDEFDPNVVRAAQFMQIGVKPTADVQTGRDRADEILAASEASTNRMLAGIDAREAAREARGRQDDPSFPRGVANYVGSLATKYGPNSYGRAAQELTNKWAKVQTAHPDADLGTALAKLKALVPTDRDEEMAPMSGQPAAAAGGAVSAEAAAIKFLQDNGAPVTPANIAATKQRLAAGR